MNCHLCDVAVAVVEQVAAEHDEEFVVLDVDEHGLTELSDHVPVIAVDGTPIAKWRISPDQLRAALTRSSEA